MDEATPNTCGSCQHWHEIPRDTSELRVGGEGRGRAVDLSAPRMGQCRAVPPVPIVVKLVQTGQGLQPICQSWLCHQFGL